MTARAFGIDARSPAPPRYTHNTVAIDVHLSLLLCVLIWAMTWALYAGLEIGDWTLLLFDPHSTKTSLISGIASTALLCVAAAGRPPPPPPPPHRAAPAPCRRALPWTRSRREFARGSVASGGARENQPRARAAVAAPPHPRERPARSTRRASTTLTSRRTRRRARRYGVTSFFEMMLLLLLVTDDIGRNTFRTAWKFAAIWGTLVVAAVSLVTIYAR
jgi:hypothetical protein